MAASSIQNPAPTVESKSAKKKKAKADRTASPAPHSVSEQASSLAPNDANGEDAEPAYLRELAKNIRNVNKKIANASKIDTLLADNRDKSLDELVALKIINADQKAAHLKKPTLQAQVAQFEEQYSQFKKLDRDFRQRIVAEKIEITKALTEKFEKEKAEAVQEIADKSAADAKKTLYDSLLTLSQFLRLAAARRTEGENQQSDESLALEGVLLQVYSGDENGVAIMLKLVEGSEETTKSVTNEPLETTFAQIKAVAATVAIPPQQAESVAGSVTEAAPAESDLTIAHASLTEITAGDDTPLTETAALTNGHTPGVDGAATNSTAEITNANVGDSASNTAGENQWDTGNGSRDLSMSQEWVEVPRNPAETETGLTATPAVQANKQSWADEQPDTPQPATATPVPPTKKTANVPSVDDGFHQVQRNRGRNEREGGWRGRGGGFRGRGRGGDGRGRGRGRGGNGGANGNGYGYRGPRRNEES